jgi:hypothetical protein
MKDNFGVIFFFVSMGLFFLLLLVLLKHSM